MIFAELKAFPGGMVTEINTYEEYLESSCELVLLITDCSYVTLYCKDPVMLEALYQQAVQCGFHRVDYVTDERRENGIVCLMKVRSFYEAPDRA